jgi:hypothetical protein
MKVIANPLHPGDVIRTHPSKGFWGCAVVLSSTDSSPEFYPRSHIAILDLIKNRKFAWKNINLEEHDIVNLNYSVRVAAHEYIQAPLPQLSIGIYTLRKLGALDVIANIDPSIIYSKPLTFDAGDGTNGTFPLCGPIPENLGHQAVINWRKINDAVNFESESQKSMEQFKKMEENRLATQREKYKSSSRT